jgi:hypothetical protein
MDAYFSHFSQVDNIDESKFSPVQWKYKIA